MDQSNNPIENQPEKPNLPENNIEAGSSQEALRPAPAPVETSNVTSPALSPTTPPPAPTPTPAPVSNDTIDLEAADSDVIEKPWVDQAEKIIEENQDNPYVEEEKEDDLGRKYKKQRFNIDVDEE